MSDISAAVPATDPAAATLDVVVLGGGGHVGLAAQPGPSRRRVCGSASTTSTARRSSGSRPGARCRSWRAAPTSSCASCCPRAAWSLAPTPDDRPRRRRGRRHRHAGRRVPQPVDAVFERAVDRRTAPAATGALVILRSTVYPGTTELRRAAPAPTAADVDVAFCPERVAQGHALEELHDAAADRRRRRRRGRRERAEALFGRLASRSSGRTRWRPSWPSSSPTPGATSSSPSPTSST